jgi:hypothetical protein
MWDTIGRYMQEQDKSYVKMQAKGPRSLMACAGRLGIHEQ